MPGGLLALVCYGNENVLVNGNPSVTWFYKIFQRYTHFSQEPIQIALDGPDQLRMDSPITLKTIIPRSADLLSDLTLRLTLPDIYSKLYTDNFYNLVRNYEFAWVRQLGARIIQSVTVTIGGQVVQEFTGEWIATRATLDMDSDKYHKWQAMIGDTATLFDPANGIYADPTLPSAYPQVTLWAPGRGDPSPPPVPQQSNNPSIPGRILRIPLGLWFSDSIANSLPLVALQYHQVEVTLVLAPIRNLYTVLDPSGVRLRPGVRSLPYEPTDQYTATYNPALYGPLPNSLNNLYGSWTDVSGSIRYFLTDIGGPIPPFDGWPLNATLEGLYTYVQQEEQNAFVSKTLRYNVRQAQNFIQSGVTTRSTYRLDVHNISTRIVWFGRRSDAQPSRNQPGNLTNWMYSGSANRPYVLPLSGQPGSVNVNGIPTAIGRSGILLPGQQREILRNAFLTANGTALLDSNDVNYYGEYVPFRYLKGNSTPFQNYGLNTQSELWPLYVYSFALDGSSIEQPSGTLNTSRIDRLELDADVWPIPVGANYTYELQIYVEVLNFLEISSGLGALKFAI
jgi:hypothetical protein